VQRPQMAQELVTRFYHRLWNEWDDAAVDDTLCADFLFRGSLGDETKGRGGWRGYRDKIREGSHDSHDFHNEIVDLVVVGNRGDLAALRAQLEEPASSAT
jgi:hypothetical protein